MEAQGQVLKKLTVKGIVGGNVSLLEPVAAMIAAGVQHANGKGKSPESVKLCQIFGRTDKAKPGATEKGEYVRFVGEFVGINLLTGERIAAGGCILPGAAEAGVYGALGPLNDRGHAQSTVEFALEVSARFDATSATKYVFEVRSLVPVKQSDPMQALLGAAGVSDTKALQDKSKKK